jgi:hypothetical protein
VVSVGDQTTRRGVWVQVGNGFGSGMGTGCGTGNGGIDCQPSSLGGTEILLLRFEGLDDLGHRAMSGFAL